MNFEQLRTWIQVHLPKQNSTIQTPSNSPNFKVQTYLAINWPNLGPNTEDPKFELFWTLFVYPKKNCKHPTPKISNLKPTNRVRPNIMQDFGNYLESNIVAIRGNSRLQNPNLNAMYLCILRVYIIYLLMWLRHLEFELKL